MVDDDLYSKYADFADIPAEDDDIDPKQLDGPSSGRPSPPSNGSAIRRIGAPVRRFGVPGEPTPAFSEAARPDPDQAYVAPDEASVAPARRPRSAAHPLRGAEATPASALPLRLDDGGQPMVRRAWLHGARLDTLQPEMRRTPDESALRSSIAHGRIRVPRVVTEPRTHEATPGLSGQDPEATD